jgi:hypothetical protein
MDGALTKWIIEPTTAMEKGNSILQLEQILAIYNKSILTFWHSI